MSGSLPVLPPIRRLVTQNDANGRSRIVEDAPATAIREYLAH
jgi:hypothetical protein